MFVAQPHSISLSLIGVDEFSPHEGYEGKGSSVILRSASIIDNTGEHYPFVG
jgi:hypothetical protein